NGVSVTVSAHEPLALRWKPTTIPTNDDAVAPPAQILSPLSSRVEPTCALVVARREPRTASWVQEPSEPRRNTNTAPFWTSRPGALTAIRSPSTEIADPNRSPALMSADGRVPASNQRPP